MVNINSSRHSQDAWIGLLIVAIGVVGFLLKSNLLELKLNFSVPHIVVLFWPIVLIAFGIGLLWARSAARRMQRDRLEGGKQ